MLGPIILIEKETNCIKGGTISNWSMLYISLNNYHEFIEKQNERPYEKRKEVIKKKDFIIA